MLNCSNALRGNDHTETMCQNSYKGFNQNQGKPWGIIHCCTSVCFCFDLGCDYTVQTILLILVIVSVWGSLKVTVESSRNHLQQLYFLHTVQPWFCIHHFEDLDLFEGHLDIVDFADGLVDHAELTLADFSVYLVVLQLAINGIC